MRTGSAPSVFARRASTFQANPLHGVHQDARTTLPPAPARQQTVSDVAMERRDALRRARAAGEAVAGSALPASGSSTPYQPSTFANISGATIVASDSMMNLGVSTPSLPQVIFSFGTAPEYEP